MYGATKTKKRRFFTLLFVPRGSFVHYVKLEMTLLLCRLMNICTYKSDLSLNVLNKFDYNVVIHVH